MGGQGQLRGLDFDDNEDAWVLEIADNIERLLGAADVLVIQERLGEVMGRTLGLAREKHNSVSTQTPQRPRGGGRGPYRSAPAGDCSSVRSEGISSQVRPSSSRPPLLARMPPHCLKKNGVREETQSSRN